MTNELPCTLYHADQKHWCKLFLVCSYGFLKGGWEMSYSVTYLWVILASVTSTYPRTVKATALAILLSRLHHLLHHLSEMYWSRTCWGHIPLLFWSCRDWVDREGDRKCNAINFPWWLSRCAPRDPASVSSPSNLELQWENIFFSEFLWKTAMTKCLWTHCFEHIREK